MIEQEHSGNLLKSLERLVEAHREGRLVGIAYSAIIREGDDGQASARSGFTIDPEHYDAATSMLGLLTVVSSHVTMVVHKNINGCFNSAEEETTSGDQ